jgi:hypothetical protein
LNSHIKLSDSKEMMRTQSFDRVAEALLEQEKYGGNPSKQDLYNEVARALLPYSKERDEHAHENRAL